MCDEIEIDKISGQSLHDIQLQFLFNPILPTATKTISAWSECMHAIDDSNGISQFANYNAESLFLFNARLKDVFNRRDTSLVFHSISLIYLFRPNKVVMVKKTHEYHIERWASRKGTVSKFESEIKKIHKSNYPYEIYGYYVVCVCARHVCKFAKHLSCDNRVAKWIFCTDLTLFVCTFHMIPQSHALLIMGDAIVEYYNHHLWRISLYFFSSSINFSQ